MRLQHSLFTLSISCVICFLYIQKTISYYNTPSISHVGKTWLHNPSVDKLGRHDVSICHSNKIVSMLQLQSSISSEDNEDETLNRIQLIPSENPIEDLIVKLKGTCVFFVGPMGSGKSTLGDAFAKKMGYRFLDTDEIAEFMIEMPITQFFSEGRETEFRQLEYDILMDLSQYTRVVVATGGGIVMKNENWGMLRHGIVVYIDMPIDDIHQRLISDPSQIAKRPLLQGVDPLETLRKLNAVRQDKYMQADVHLVVPKMPLTPDELAVYTAQTILDFIAINPPRWEGWKKKRDDMAIEAAARMNPAATASAGVGFGDNRGDATIKRISLGGETKSQDDEDFPTPLQ